MWMRTLVRKHHQQRIECCTNIIIIIGPQHKHIQTMKQRHQVTLREALYCALDGINLVCCDMLTLILSLSLSYPRSLYRALDKICWL